MSQTIEDNKNNEYFTYVGVRRVMREAGCELAAKDAVNELRNRLQKIATDITVKAKSLVNHRGAKKITYDDIVMAIEGVDAEIDTKRQVELLQQRLASLKIMIRNSEKIEEE